MTRMALTDARCTKCQNTWKQRIYSSANVSLDPTLKAKVVSGEIFRFTCPSCGHTEHAQYECLYHDMGKALMISLTSVEEIDKTKEALSLALGALPTRDFYRLRLVTSVHDLWEKILVFDAELNDGMVELMKGLLPTQNPELKGALLRFQAIDDAGDLAFAVIRPGAKVEFVSVSREFYESVRAKAFSDLDKLTDVRGQWLRVDKDMVVKHILSKRNV